MVTLKVELSKKSMIFLSLFGLFLLIGGFVVASLGTVPNPGHAVSDIQKCGANEVLKMDATGTSWACGTITTTTPATVLPGTLCGFNDLIGISDNHHATNCNGVSISGGNCPSGYSYTKIMDVSGDDAYACVKL